ncbi:hypothetical protein LCGC14_1389920 [marine sediment metagenome]|uniref:Uncharacterized protein n=1 Tax=marine sediment metagenome TaxID=412755 RepID=A0A0F9MFV2_9ZZZZ
MGAWEYAFIFALWAAIAAKPGTADPVFPVILTPGEFMVVWIGLGVWAFLMVIFRPKKP